MSRRTVLYLTGALAAILVAATVALAAVPQTINYQGYLADSSGNSVNGTVQMQFTLYSSQSVTATPLWTETHQSVQVADGKYSVVLGNGSPTPVPINLPFDMPYYLGVKVGSDSEMTPRLPLTSMGYAFRAAQAEGLSSTGTIMATNAIVSTVPTGVAPMAVSSTTLVPNLNVEMVGGKHASDFVLKAGDTMTGSLALSAGNISLPTTTANSGAITQNGSPLIHTYGMSNFFAGTNAGNFTMTTGYNNTASGYNALHSNTTGQANTASGSGALQNNTTGGNNTASGFYALSANTSGYYNTASGESALASNTTGYANTASGESALASNTTGTYNTAIGYLAGYAGFNQTIGFNNTYIGANVYGSAGESNVIRIGSGSTDTYIAGIYAQTSSGGLAVYINNNGKLGTTTSARRFKENITDMGDVSDGLMKLRPVTFNYKPEYSDGSHLLQYGLIAEEVAEVYPDMVSYDKDGNMNSVYYQFVNAMLLNEVQKQHLKIESQNSELEAQRLEIESLKSQIAEIKQMLGARP